MLKFIKKLFQSQQRDHFFWDLYQAQRSPDSKAMTMLFEQYN